LFRGSIGRTDLAGGSHKLLISGIKEKLLNLPPETVVYSGHGPLTTIEEEMRSNFYLQ
jgi:glyoxylase-like metal-dependent hydrolase (beta-lactamase superfamily II)